MVAPRASLLVMSRVDSLSSLPKFNLCIALDICLDTTGVTVPDSRTMADLASLPADWIVTSGQFTKTAHTTVYPAVDPTKAENSLDSKIVVVSGASRGLGAKSIAPAFVKAGVRAIVLIATNAAKLAGVEGDLKKINPDVETMALGVDISSAEQVKKAWEEINARFKKVDILVNNAGVETSDSDKTHEQDPEVFFRNFVSRHHSPLDATLRLLALANTGPLNSGSQRQRHPHDDTAIPEGSCPLGHDH